jgi:hypothetical protein
MAKIVVAETIDTSVLEKNSNVSEDILELAGVLGTLKVNQAVTLTPEDNETFRTLKVRASRAATHANLEIKYGKTVNGGLMVWLMREQDRPKKRAPRKVK